MSRVGEMVTDENGSTEITEGTRVWYKCSRCHHNALIDEAGIIAAKETAENRNLLKEQCTSYSPEKSYSIGDAIYHSEWDDMGWVREKVKTSDGSYAILVEFQKLGERKLIDSLPPEEPDKVPE